MILKVVPLPHCVCVPRYKTPGAAGLDLYASGSHVVHVHNSAKIPTGIKIEIPPGHVGFVTPRSGLAVSRGLTVLNTPGTIDEDYRGEIHVILHNTSGFPHRIKEGDRIAQLVILQRPTVDVQLVDESDLTPTQRGDGGFGSTGR